jgi:hypothetical protein
MASPVLDQELVWTVTGLPAGGASAVGSIAPFPPEIRGQFVELIVYVEFSHTTDSGKVSIETAYSPDYAGTWALVGNTIDWAAIDTTKYGAVTGVFGALRARISTGVTTGSLKVKVVAAHNAP